MAVIPLEASASHLRSIATKEAIAITDDAITLIAQISQGGMRDAESLLDQLSLLEGEVTVDRVWDLVGSVPERDLMALLEAIAQNNPEILLDSVRRLMDRGREPLIVLQNLASFYRDLLIAKTAPTRNDLVALTAPTWAALCNFAKALDLHTILAGQQQLRRSEDQIKSTTQPRLWLEVTLMGLLPSAVSSQQSAVSGQRSAASSQVLPTVAESAPTLPPKLAVTPSHVEAIAPVAKELPVVKEPPVAKEPSVVKDAPQAEAIVEPVTRTSDASLPLVTNQPAGANADLSQIWQEILSHIDLKGTRAMLSVNCHLLKQNDHEILVGVKAQSMLKMITGMIPQLEKAATKAFKTKVKVALQVSESAPPTAPTTQQAETVDHRPSAAETNRSNIDRPTQVSTAKATPPNAGQATPASQSDTQASESNQQRFNHAAQAPADDFLTVPTLDQWQQEDEVTRAAKQLADFFGGRVVDMSDSDTVAETPKLTEMDAASLLETAALPETEYEPDSDDDVPF